MKYLIPILFIYFLSACDEIKPTLPVSNGEGGEISVFIPKEYRGKGIEEQLEKSLLVKIDGLMGSEKSFDLLFVEDDDMKKLIHRNVLEINIDASNKEEVFVKETALRAKDQYHMVVYASNLEGIMNTIDNRAEQIIEGFNREENSRMLRYVTQRANPNVQNGVYKKQGVSIKVPNDFKEFVYNQKEIAYLRGWETKTGEAGKLIIQEYLFIFNYPIRNQEFELKEGVAVSKINKVLKAYIEFDNKQEDNQAYLQITRDDVFPISSRLIDHHGNKALELRGNFKAESEDSTSTQFGGYFVARAIEDVNSGRIVVVMGAVNTPREFGYREYMRKLNQIISTAKFN